MFRKQIEKVCRSHRTSGIGSLNGTQMVDTRDIFNFLSKTYFDAYPNMRFSDNTWVKIKSINDECIDDGLLLINDNYILTEDGKIDGTKNITGLGKATIHPSNTILAGYPEQYTVANHNGNSLIVLKDMDSLKQTIKDLDLEYDRNLHDNRGLSIEECMEYTSYVQFLVPQLYPPCVIAKNTGDFGKPKTVLPKTALVTYTIATKSRKFTQYGNGKEFLKGLMYSCFFVSK